MKINLEELANIPDNTLTIPFCENSLNGIDNVTPIKGSITANLTPYGVVIKGEIETDIKLECDRCLTEYTYHLDIDINEKFIKESLASEETNELEIKNENFVEELEGRVEIDVTDLIYQAIILNTPSKKLCLEECPGSEAYQKMKSEKPIDPRLEIFKQYTEQKNEDDKK